MAVWMGKPFLHSQHKMVADSLTWWFQSVEKAPTSLYIWMHNIIWIYIILIHIMWIHAIEIHIYHMNSCHMNSYLLFEFIYFLTIHFPYLLKQCLESIWVPSGVSSTCIYQMVWWWYGVLTFVVKLKCIVLHTIIKLSEKLVPGTFAQNVRDYWQWLLLRSYDFVQLTWVTDPAYSVVLLWNAEWGWRPFTLLLWC